MADYEKPVIHGVTATGDKKAILVSDDGNLGVSIDGGVTVDNGTPITGQSLSSGSGIIGWLSNIYKFLNDILGIKTSAASISITPASNASFVSSGNVASASTDSGNPVKIGGVYLSTRPTFSSGQRGDVQLSARGGLIADYEDYVTNPNNINTVDSGSNSAAGANGQTIVSGNPSNNSTVTLLVSGNSSFAIQISGTWVGTLQFERSLDGGSTWTAVGAFAAGTNFITQTTTANGNFHGNCSSSNGMRVRATAWTSGVASIRILAGQGTGTITVGNPIRLFDQVSSSQANIKAASTASLGTDTALVVTERPNISATILSVTTAATGTNYTAFGSQSCTLLDLVNFSGTDIEYLRNGTGTAFRIPNNSGRTIKAITNANQISIRRVDTSNTQVTVQAEALL